MEQNADFSFHKSERVCSRRIIEALFAGGNKSMSAFPLRAVFMTLPSEEHAPAASVLISVSKRRFKRAVKRNRVKRQIREAYRHNKTILEQALGPYGNLRVVVAFLWLSDRLYTSAEVAENVKRLMVRIAEQLPPRTD
ncbi:MAG: ribonuclease P protein component [Paraprevotella sp.]|nr:ribonuclease P protein component [Paraprevotella sp.]